MKRSLIADVTARMIVRSALVLSIYLLAAGHNQPGGGFIGGLVAGAGIALVFVAGGLDDVRRLLPIRPWTVLGLGLVITVSCAVVPLFAGGAVLSQDFWTFDLAVLGKVKVTSALAFDTGVYLVVVGLVLMAFEALGEDDQPVAHRDVPRDLEDGGVHR